MKSQKLFLQVIAALFLFYSCQQKADVKITDTEMGPLSDFPLKKVTLLDGPFRDAQLTDLNYILALNADRLLAPYVREAGMEPKAPGYGNWESTGLDGHIGGHYLSALAMMYASTGNEELRDRLDYMIDVLESCQNAHGNGYLGGIPGGVAMWEEIRRGNIDAGNFSLNGKWVPLYNMHKIYAGLRDAYWIAGNEKARDMLIALSDWMLELTRGLSDSQIQDMLRSEHGGLNEVFTDVAFITGDSAYAEMADRFSHREILDPLMAKEDRLTGLHANTQIPKVIGFKRLADFQNNPSWDRASGFFWNNVVNHRSVSIGGNSVREHFHSSDDFSPMIESEQGPETCNTYNMLRLTKMLFLTHPEAKYIDYYERALYNHILSSQHPNGGFVYFTPMRPRHYRVYSQPEVSFWCCVGSGLENHAKYGEMIYARAEDEVVVNLFMSSQLNWEEKGLMLIQNSRFPEKGNTRIELDLEKPQEMTISLRHPGWVKLGEFEVQINGKPVVHDSRSSSYLRMYRSWQDGDVITVNMPMKTSVEFFPDSSNWASVLKGPIVMAAVTDSTDLEGLWADEGRMAHVASGEMYPVDKSPKLIATDKKGLMDQFETDDKGNLVYTGDIHPAGYNNIELVPFYTIHEARYMVYWPVMDRETLNSTLADIQKREEEIRLLNTRTIDQVATGEQQPETEHNFKGKASRSGNNGGKFWRDALKWFSYDLKQGPVADKTLRIRYFSGDAGRNFYIIVNGQILDKVVLQPGETPFYTVDYSIPASYLNNSGVLNLRFEAGEGSVAGGIYHIRLMENEEHP